MTDLVGDGVEASRAEVGASDDREVVVGVGQASRRGGRVAGSPAATAGEEETGCPASVPSGVTSSPPHAAVNKRMNSAAAGSNLAGKVRTRIPTLP